MSRHITSLNCIIRSLRGPDLDHGFLDVIRSFRPFDLSRDAAGEILRERMRNGLLTVVADFAEQVVGTASMLVDYKFINNGGKVAIVEDVIVLPQFQGLGIGRRLVAALEDEAQRIGCYKICLYCSDDLVPYYEQLGFVYTDQFMRKDLV